MDDIEDIDDKSSKRLHRRKLRRGILNFIALTFFVLSLYVISLIHENNQRSLSSWASTDEWKIQRAKMILNQGKKNIDTTISKEEEYNKRELSESNPHKWINPHILPNLPGEDDSEIKSTLRKAMEKIRRYGINSKSFRTSYGDTEAEYKEWEKYADNDSTSDSQPRVDYRKIKYKYPDLLMKPPTKQGIYPKLQPLGKLLEIWPQDDLDSIRELDEVLLHFDYSNVTERNAALKFRDAEIPFKVYNVPEIDIASQKWTDEYVNNGFSRDYVTARGHCQQSDNNFFSWFRNQNWDVDLMGPPPTIDIDWTYEQWAKHARYADKVSLPINKRHYYWQCGVPSEEKYAREREKSFISRDLPSFSDTSNNFFSFHVDEQKGIQCRMGERGVTAATHYDGGRNMVAMIKGAKRYILSPPKSCPQLGIVNQRQHPVFRHSLLNFAHINLLNDDSKTKGMTMKERKWLEIAKDAPSLSTVLKEGEVLYIPSHWFHYITSLQKSAQCNVRSGRDTGSTKEFGGFEDVKQCVGSDNVL